MGDGCELDNKYDFLNSDSATLQIQKLFVVQTLDKQFWQTKILSTLKVKFGKFDAISSFYMI